MRAATPNDIPDIVEMLRRFHAASGEPFEFDPLASETSLRGMIEAGGVFRTAAGAIGGIVSPSWASRSWICAVELFWWAEDGRGVSLLSAFERWAKSQGANEIRMTTLETLPAARRIMRRRGYSVAETSYRKAV